MKVSKVNDGVTIRRYDQNWTDWLTYWSVDFNFESKRRDHRIQSPETNAWGGTGRRFLLKMNGNLSVRAKTGNWN